MMQGNGEKNGEGDGLSRSNHDDHEVTALSNNGDNGDDSRVVPIETSSSTDDHNRHWVGNADGSSGCEGRPNSRPSSDRWRDLYAEALQDYPRARAAAQTHFRVDAAHISDVSEDHFDQLERLMIDSLPARTALAFEASRRRDESDLDEALRRHRIRFAERLDRLANAQREERHRQCLALARSVSLGPLFANWPAPATDNCAPFYLLVSKHGTKGALFSVRFGPGPVETTRLVAQIQVCDNTFALGANVLGAPLAPYADLVPTLIRGILHKRIQRSYHYRPDKFRVDRATPPGLVLGAVADHMTVVNEVTLPLSVCTTLWPRRDRALRDEPRKTVKAAWFNESQLEAILGTIASYEAAEAIAVTAPRYGRTDPLDAHSTFFGPPPNRSTGLLCANGTGPLSLLQTVKTRIAEAPWRVPLADLPDDLAEPLALAIWQRACTSRRSGDGTLPDAHRLLDVAHYWGFKPTPAQRERPEWLCHGLMAVARERASTLQRERLVPLSWTATFRPCFPAAQEREAVGRVAERLRMLSDIQFKAGQSAHMRVNVMLAFADMYKRSPCQSDSPLIDKAIDLAARANDLSTESATTARAKVSASIQAQLALTSVRGGLGVSARDLSSPSATARLFGGVLGTKSPTKQVAFFRYETTDLVRVDRDNPSRGSSDGSDRGDWSNEIITGNGSSGDEDDDPVAAHNDHEAANIPWFDTPLEFL
jgi:hypothetical protein